MRRVVVVLGLALLIAGSSFAVTSDETPKYTIKEVMKKVHGRPNLVKKITSGQATDADKATLVEYYQSMPLNTPKKGDAAAFKKLAEAMLVAAIAVKNGERDGITKLTKATNCMGCHNVYK